MSRIQEILARAERDGTARRNQGVEATGAAPAAMEGAEVLDSRPLFPRAPAGGFAGAATVAPPPAVEPPPEIREVPAALHASLVAGLDPISSAAEQYRAIRTRLTLLEETAPVRVVLVTSPGKGEGKSVTAANLAITMAQEVQRNVVLVDADLRSPSVDALFGIERSPGLADVLSGAITIDEALVHLRDHRLTVLPAGGDAAFPTELLGSSAMRRTIDTLRARFDRVVLDLPPALPFADVGTAAPLGDGVVMVVRAGTTQRPMLEQALAAFQTDRVLGIVLNAKES